MIRELFLEYKEVTVRILEMIDKDEEFDELMESREIILKKIFLESREGKRINEVYAELDIEGIDKKLYEKINLEMLKTKEEIREIQNRKSATMVYGGANRSKNIFSAKI